MEGVFSPEIILNIINQVYINNKIEGIIRSLFQEELVILKEKLEEQEKRETDNATKTLGRVKK